MKLPKSIETILSHNSYTIDSIGKSNAKVLCFDDMVLKVEEESDESHNEHNIMAWLSDKLCVPQIICSDQEDGINYLLMSKIPGDMVCAAHILDEPKTVVKLLAQGLKMLWKVDITNCPYNNSLGNKLKSAELNVLNNLCDVEDSEPGTYGPKGFKDPKELLQWLKDNQPKEELVFSHGDFCLPNIFVQNDKISGFIDLGRSGIADKYHDIALCYRSLVHNYDGSYGGRVREDIDPNLLFEELGIEPDWNKIRYYILLDELF